MEELQRKKKEDEAKKVELARIEAEEAELRRKEVQILFIHFFNM